MTLSVSIWFARLSFLNRSLDGWKEGCLCHLKKEIRNVSWFYDRAVSMALDINYIRLVTEKKGIIDNRMNDVGWQIYIKSDDNRRGHDDNGLVRCQVTTTRHLLSDHFKTFPNGLYSDNDLIIRYWPCKKGKTDMKSSPFSIYFRKPHFAILSRSLRYPSLGYGIVFVCMNKSNKNSSHSSE